jgi:acylphosphatase
MIARRLIISGRVQGVGFRYALADEARERKLRGWVRNRRDGSVEAVVAGPEADVAAVIAWARRGPPAARVSQVTIEPATTDIGEFEIINTA